MTYLNKKPPTQSMSIQASVRCEGASGEELLFIEAESFVTFSIHPTQIIALAK